MKASEDLSELQSQSVEVCCSALYDHPLASWLMGSSFHPGGLQLTDEMADIAGVGVETRLLDVGCGHGASGIHLAATRGSDVTGITLELAGVQAAAKRAKEQGQGGIRFEQADIYSYQSGVNQFDAVLMECVLSTLEAKGEAMARVFELLEPGGRIALSDVTVSGTLPNKITGSIASALCIGDALSLDDYSGLMRSAGFEVIVAENVEHVTLQFVKRLNTMLLTASVAAGLGKINVDRETLKQVRQLLKVVRSTVEDGTLGYCMIVAEKPAG